MTATATDSPAAEQIARLADFIMQHIPGEPSRSEGAVDTAIRLLRAAPDAARLREALQFYANPENWGKDDWGVPSVITSPEYGNPGQVARDALAGGSSSQEGEAGMTEAGVPKEVHE